MRIRPWLRPRRLAGIALAGAATWLGSALVVAHSLTARHAGGPGVLPDVDWATACDVRLEARDGAHVPATTFDLERAHGTAVLLHPNDGTRASMTGAAHAWADLGYGSIALTLRAHGAAEGARNDVGWSARLDVVAAVEWAAARRPGPVFVHGVSLGAAAACLAGPEHSREARARIAGHVLESPFVDLRTAVRSRTAMRLPPLVDDVAALGLSVVAPVFIGDVDRISPLAAASTLPGRVLVLSGRRDARAPAVETRRFAEALGERATLVERDVGHAAWHAAGYRGALGRDLRAWLGSE